MHTLRGERQLAETDLNQADKIFIESGDQPQRGATAYRQAALTQMSGDLDGAIAQLEQALAWMADDALARDRAGAHQRLAILYAAQGRLPDAEAHFQRAIDLGEPEVQAAAYIKLGGLRREAGDNQAASEYFVKALAVVERLNHRLQRAFLHQELGYLALQTGQRQQAEDHFQKAGELYQQLGYLAGLAYTQHSLGNIAFTGGDFETAERRFAAALEINLAQGLEANAAYNRFMLGVAAQRRGRPEDARQLYNQALQAGERMKDKGLQASCQYQLAGLAFDQDDLPAARPLAEQAYGLAREIQDRQTEASALALIGRIQAREGQLILALKSLDDAFELFSTFNPPDAARVKSIIQAIDPTIPVEGESPSGLDRVESGGTILMTNIDGLGSGRFELGSQPGEALSAAGLPSAGLVPGADTLPAVPAWDWTTAIDRIEDGGDYDEANQEERSNAQPNQRPQPNGLPGSEFFDSASSNPPAPPIVSGSKALRRAAAR